MAPPAPPIAPQIPTARLRAVPSLKVVVRIESEAGATIAPPRPWTARATYQLDLRIREAAGHRGEREQGEAGDEDTPAPQQVSRATAQQQKAGEGDRVCVHHPLEVCSEKPRPCRIEGRATLTTETSRMTMNCARHARISVARRCGLAAAVPVAAVSGMFS